MNAVSSPSSDCRSARNGRALRGDHNECPACLLKFNSTAAFDMHRTGTFGRDRRCMSEAEMLADGMALNADGWWVTKAYDGPARARGEGL